MGRKKKGGFKKGVSKPSGALIAVGGFVLAGLAGYGAAKLAQSTFGARGILKHGAGLAVGGVPGAAGSMIGDVLEGRGLDLSLTMPALGGASAQSSGTTF